MFLESGNFDGRRGGETPHAGLYVPDSACFYMAVQAPASCGGVYLFLGCFLSSLPFLCYEDMTALYCMLGVGGLFFFFFFFWVTGWGRVFRWSRRDILNSQYSWVEELCCEVVGFVV